MLKQTLELFSVDDGIFEIRALNCWDRNPEFTCTRTGYFSDLDAAVAAVQDLEKNWHPEGIYLTLNPVLPDLIGRAANRLRKGKKDESTKDHEIIRRRWFFLDFDPKRPAGISSTDQELAAAKERCDLCKSWLTECGWPSPIVAMSGNGWHLLYRIDAPTEDEDLLKRCLASVATRFLTPAVSVDQKVFNAARISKLYGTLARKGDHTDARPHRRSEIIDLPDPIEVVPLSALEWLAGPKEEKKQATADSETLRVEHWLTRHGIQILNTETKGDGTLVWFIPCPGQASHSGKNADTDCCVTQEPSGAIGGHCFHDSCGMKSWQDLKGAIGPLEYEDYHEEEEDNGVDISRLPIFRVSKNPVEPRPQPVVQPLTVADADEMDDDELDEVVGLVDSEFPADCLRPPGIIGEIIDYNLQTAKYPQPEHALAGALALMSLVTGRRICDESGTRTNLLIVALGPTRSGKEHPRQVNKKILEICGAEKMYEEKLASHSSLHGFLQISHAGLLMNDEFGDFLALARSTKGANTQPAQIISAIIKLYSSSASKYKADRYADNSKQVEINQPHLVLYGTSTGEVFWKHVTPEYLSGGLFGRTIIIENRGYVDPQPLQSRKVPLPESIVREVQGWLGCFSHYNLLFWENPEPIVVPHTPDALVRFEKHELAISQKRKRETPLRAALWSGTAEITAKLALLFACSRSRNPLQVQVEDVDLAIRLSNWLTRRKVDLSQDNVAENQTESAAKRVYRIIKDAGQGGISQRQLSRRTQWLKEKERMELVNGLVNSDLIYRDNVKTGKRDKTVLMARQYVKQRLLN